MNTCQFNNYWSPMNFSSIDKNIFLKAITRHAVNKHQTNISLLNVHSGQQ